MDEISRQRNALKKLTEWRDREAAQRGLPEYLVLPNTTINAIAVALPSNKEELLGVKGIKEAKLREFGEIILALVNNMEAKSEDAQDSTAHVDTPEAMSVGQYLDVVNRSLRLTGVVKIIGEVGQVKQQGGAVYFSIKDPKEGSILSVFMWKSQYDIYGIELVEGMQVMLTGICEIYKPTGRLSYRADSVELVGEGALKKAYDELRKRLTNEGLFDSSRKRILPEYPRKIGLITSKGGAVIHDFLNNLGKYGYKISFMDSRVEGVLAVKEILAAVDHLSKIDIDVLVIIRGGGSLESLQAFNNEELVRAISSFPRPVVCAIGHDQDVPLAQLAADYSPSTPTACTALLNDSWGEASHVLNNAERLIVASIADSFYKAKELITRSEISFTSLFEEVLKYFTRIETRFTNSIQILEGKIQVLSVKISSLSELLSEKLDTVLKNAALRIDAYGTQIRLHDPERLLSSGYAIVKHNGKIVRSTSNAIIGSVIEVSVADGRIGATVNNIYPHDKTK